MFQLNKLKKDLNNKHTELNPENRIINPFKLSFYRI
jgi:hypothetical protein